MGTTPDRRRRAVRGRAREEGLIESFFFIRYLERGPHSGCRLRTESERSIDARVHSYCRFLRPLAIDTN